MKQVRMGVIGTGGRGQGLMKTLSCCEEADIVAVCDVYEDRVQAAADKVADRCGKRPKTYLDYEALLGDPEVDAVLVASGWEWHVPIAIAAMRHGKITAMEVGGSYSIEECRALIDAYEETKTPFMFLENCCYDKIELLATSLARAGKLGEIVHCHGAYAHDLRKELASSRLNRHYRLQHYLDRNCENYPTHDLGPIAKLLDINRGNRMVRLVSVASKSAGLKQYIDDGNVDDPSLQGEVVRQGDIISTIITCANGETITLTLDTTLPRYYSREFTVRGTLGLVAQEPEMVFIDGEADGHSYAKNEKNAGQYSAYLPDIWKNITEEELKLGHGGMDYLMLKEFLRAILAGEEMPIDVYDAAAWMCVTVLSEQSIREGGMPQEFPDFTNGAWKTRPRRDVVAFPQI